MQSGKQEPFLNITQKSIIIIFLVIILTSFLVFRNLFYQPTILLKSFGELSIDPEIALNNNKPTFLEFYAEWCEVCKEMAPKVSSIKEEYESDINFVFLNVDNSKWSNYLRDYNVNGIPQVNLFDNQGNLEETFIGKQEEKNIRLSLENLKKGMKSSQQIVNSNSSIIKENRNNQASPRSHS